MEFVLKADGASRLSSRGPGQARRDPLHPNAAELYRRRVADLQNALNATDDSRQQAASVLRAMIDRRSPHSSCNATLAWYRARPQRPPLPQRSAFQWYPASYTKER